MKNNMKKSKMIIILIIIIISFLVVNCEEPAKADDPPIINMVSFVHDATNNLLTITSNSIPNHTTGAFPNSGNPNTIQPQSITVRVPTNPTKSPAAPGTPVSAQGKLFGIAINGVPFDPFTGEYYDPSTGARAAPNTGGLTWNYDGLGSTNMGEALGMDFNLAHVQPNGTYHYHGDPSSLDEGTSSKHSPLIGFSGDGYFVFGQYGYGSNSSTIIKMASCWETITNRTGADAPPVNATFPLGTFVQDYQKGGACSNAATTLDEFNGHTGIFPKAAVERFIQYYATSSYTDNGDGTITMYHYHLHYQYKKK